MNAFSCDFWAIEPRSLQQFLALAEAGINANSEMVAASRESRREKTIAILPIHGVLEARPSWLGSFLGMSSYESLGYAFDSLVMDESVKGIILDVMSPGGMVYGCRELANKIYSARGTKPIISLANPMAASGGYWLAAAADRVVSLPSADVGSVGVIWQHVDISQLNEREGVKITTIRSTDSPFKAEMNADEPLSNEARDTMQSRADEIHAEFVGDLAKFRGVSVDHVKEQFGKGRVVDSKRAKAAGMIDQVMTLQELAYKMAAGRIRIANTKAEDDWNAPTDRELRLQRAAAIRAIAEQPDPQPEEDHEQV